MAWGGLDLAGLVTRVIVVQFRTELEWYLLFSLNSSNLTAHNFIYRLVYCVFNSSMLIFGRDCAIWWYILPLTGKEVGRCVDLNRRHICIYLPLVHIDPVVIRFPYYSSQITAFLWESCAEYFNHLRQDDRGDFDVSFYVLLTGNSRTFWLILNVYLEVWRLFAFDHACMNGCFHEMFVTKMLFLFDLRSLRCNLKSQAEGVERFRIQASLDYCVTKFDRYLAVFKAL